MFILYFIFIFLTIYLYFKYFSGGILVQRHLLAMTR